MDEGTTTISSRLRPVKGKEDTRRFVELPFRGRVYLIAIYTAGLFIFAFQLPSLEGHHLGFAVSLGIISGIVGSIKVIAPHGRAKFSADTVFYGIVYLVGGLPTLLFAHILSIIIQTRTRTFRNDQWYVWLFNLYVYSIACFVMDVAFLWLNTLLPSQSTYNIPISLIGFVSYSIANMMLVALVIYFVNGIPIKNSKVFTVTNIMRETCFLCISLATVMVWSIEPLAVLITLSPVYILYSSFQLPLLKAKSEIDQKTGLLNSAAFLDTLKSEVKRANRYDRPLVLVMADLDYMRLVNNVHGHLAGDHVLAEIGETLKRTFREQDFVARFGGEEFGIILPDTSHEVVIDVVERARAAIDELLIKPDNCDMPIRVTMSFGIARRDEDTKNARDLIDQADQALYHAKESGRNCIGIYKDNKVLCLTMPFSVPVDHSIATEQRMEFLG